MSSGADPGALPDAIVLDLREVRIVIAAIVDALDDRPDRQELRRAGRLLAAKLWPVLARLPLRGRQS